MNFVKQLYQTNQNVYKINDRGSGAWLVISVLPQAGGLEDYKYLIENKATRARNTLPQGLLTSDEETNSELSSHQMDCGPSLNPNDRSEKIEDLNLSCASMFSDISDSLFAGLQSPGNKAQIEFDMQNISDSVFDDIHTGLTDEEDLDGSSLQLDKSSVPVEHPLSPIIDLTKDENAVEKNKPAAFNIVDSSFQPDILKTNNPEDGSIKLDMERDDGDAVSIAVETPIKHHLPNGVATSLVQAVDQAVDLSPPPVVNQAADFSSRPVLNQAADLSPRSVLNQAVDLSSCPVLNQAVDLADKLLRGQALKGGYSLASPNRVYTLTMQLDGNLVMSCTHGAVTWAIGTPGLGAGAYLEFGSDGNLVLYDASEVSGWDAGTSGSKAKAVVLQDDGQLVMCSKEDGSEVWIGVGNFIREGIYEYLDGKEKSDSDTVVIKKVGENFMWNNGAGEVWTLYPTDEINVLRVGEDSPFYTSANHRTAVFNAVGVSGPFGSMFVLNQAVDLSPFNQAVDLSPRPVCQDFNFSPAEFEFPESLGTFSYGGKEVPASNDLITANVEYPKIDVVDPANNLQVGLVVDVETSAEINPAIKKTPKNECLDDQFQKFMNNQDANFALSTPVVLSNVQPYDSSPQSHELSPPLVGGAPVQNEVPLLADGVETRQAPRRETSFKEHLVDRETNRDVFSKPAPVRKGIKLSLKKTGSKKSWRVLFPEDSNPVEESLPKSSGIKVKNVIKVLSPEKPSSPVHETSSSWNQDLNNVLADLTDSENESDEDDDVPLVAKRRVPGLVESDSESDEEDEIVPFGAGNYVLTEKPDNSSVCFGDEHNQSFEIVAEVSPPRGVPSWDQLGLSGRGERVLATGNEDFLVDLQVDQETVDDEELKMTDLASQLERALEDFEFEFSNVDEVNGLRPVERELTRLQYLKQEFESLRPKKDLLLGSAFKSEEIKKIRVKWDKVEETFENENEELKVLKEYYSAVPNGGDGVENTATADPKEYQPRFFTEAEIKLIQNDSDGAEGCRKKRRILGLFKDFIRKCGETRELSEMPHKEVSIAMGSFVYTLTKEDGTHHDTSTLRSDLSRLSVVVRGIVGVNPTTHVDFESFRTLKKAKIRKAKEQPGNGMRKHQADVIYPEEVKFMFYVGALNICSGWGITRIIYFYLGAVCNHRAVTDMATLTLENVQITYDDEGQPMYAEVCLQKQKRDQGEKEVPVKRPRILPIEDKSRCFFPAWFKLQRERAKLPKPFRMQNSRVFLEPRTTSDYVGTKNDCLFKPKYLSDHHLRNLVHNACIEAGLRLEKRKICNSSVRILCFKDQIDAGISSEEAQALDGHLSTATRRHYDRGNEDNYDVYGAALASAITGSGAILPKPAGVRLTENLLDPPNVKPKVTQVTPTVLDLKPKEKAVIMSSGDEVRACLPGYSGSYDKGAFVDLQAGLSASYKQHKAEKYDLFRSNQNDELFGRDSSGKNMPPLPDVMAPDQVEILPRQKLGADGQAAGSSVEHFRAPLILKELPIGGNMVNQKRPADESLPKTVKKSRPSKGDIFEDDPVFAKTSFAPMTWPCRLVSIIRDEEDGQVEAYRVQLFGLNSSENVNISKVHPVNSVTYTRFCNPSMNKRKQLFVEKFPQALRTVKELAESKGTVVRNLKAVPDSENKEN